jgi:hypothetical protein
MLAANAVNSKIRPAANVAFPTLAGHAGVVNQRQLTR